MWALCFSSSAPEHSGMYEVRFSMDTETDTHKLHFDESDRMWRLSEDAPKDSALLLPVMAQWRPLPQ